MSRRPTLPALLALLSFLLASSCRGTAPNPDVDSIQIAKGLRVQLLEQAPDLAERVPIVGNVGSTRVSTRSELLLSFHEEGGQEQALEQIDSAYGEWEQYLQDLRAYESRREPARKQASLQLDKYDGCPNCIRRLTKTLGEVNQAQRPDRPPGLTLQALQLELQRAKSASVEVRAAAKTKETARKLVEVENWTSGAESKRPAEDPQLSALAKDLKQLQEQVQELEEKANAADESLAARVQKDTGVDPRTSFAAGSLGEALQTEFVHLKDSIKDRAEKLALDPGIEAQNAKDLKVIRRKLGDFLPPGRIVMENTGLEHRDGLVVEVDVMYEVPDPADDTKTVTETDERARFAVELQDYGWRTHRRGSLIFHRADTVGPESSDKPWRANVAALYEWGYLERYPSDLGHAWNALEPSFGFHVASVDLDPDTGFEVGAGANLSFFDGLLSFGYGYDLMAERFYYFLGGDLFKLVDTLK